MAQPLWKTGRRCLRKLKIELTCDPAVPLLGICVDKITIQKDTCTPMFPAALFAIAKTWKQPECPLQNKRLRRCGAYIQCSAIKKNEIVPCAATCL